MLILFIYLRIGPVNLKYFIIVFSYTKIIEIFRNFIRTFTVGNDLEAFYIRQLEILYRIGEYALNLDCCHLYNNPRTRTLYEQLIKYPQEMIPVLDHVVNEIFAT